MDTLNEVMAELLIDQYDRLGTIHFPNMTKPNKKTKGDKSNDTEN